MFKLWITQKKKRWSISHWASIRKYIAQDISGKHLVPIKGTSLRMKPCWSRKRRQETLGVFFWFVFCSIGSILTLSLPYVHFVYLVQYVFFIVYVWICLTTKTIQNYKLELMMATNFIKINITNSTTATISMSASTTSLGSLIGHQIIDIKERSTETW